MQFKKIIQSEIDFTRTFSLIAQAYEEIAVMKMRKVRTSVLSTREYLSRLSEVFYDLKKAKARQKLQESVADKLKQTKAATYKKPAKIKPRDELLIAEIEQGKQIAPPEKLQKTVSVLLSANTTLYGGLIQRIFKLFIQNVSKDNSDIIIVGRVGRRLYEEQADKKAYLYFEIPDIEISLENLKPVIFHLVKYQKIMVYYGRYDSVVTQKEISSNISGDQPFELTAEPKPEADATSQFLFEPSLDVILAFFEDLIASSLFRQTVHETQLARWASRILSMEKAQVNIDTQLTELRLSNLKIQKQQQNRTQLERLAGISFWRH